jgi:tetratricopeptide (TPR) repeat protein
VRATNRRLVVLRYALDLLTEVDRADAAELVEREMRVLRLGRRADAEARLARAAAPSAATMVETLTWSWQQLVERGQLERAAALAQLAAEYRERAKAEGEVLDPVQSLVATERGLRERALARRHLEALRLALAANAEGGNLLLENEIRAREVALVDGRVGDLEHLRTSFPPMLLSFVEDAARSYDERGQHERAAACASLAGELRQGPPAAGAPVPEAPAPDMGETLDDLGPAASGAAEEEGDLLRQIVLLRARLDALERRLEELARDRR